MSAEYIVNQSRNQQDLSDFSLYEQLLERLPIKSQKIIGYLGSFFLKSKPIFPSLETIAKETGIAFGTVENLMAKIKGLGIILVKERCFNSSNVYDFNPIFKTKRGKSMIWSCVRLYREFKEKNAVLTVKLRYNINNKINNIRKKVISTYAEAWDFIFNKGKREAKRERYKLAMDKIQQERLEKKKLANTKWQCDNNDVMYGYDELMSCNVSRIFAEEERKRFRAEIKAAQDLARSKYRVLSHEEALKKITIEKSSNNGLWEEFRLKLAGSLST
jgi:hypothetical protein